MSARQRATGCAGYNVEISPSRRWRPASEPPRRTGASDTGARCRISYRRARRLWLAALTVLGVVALPAAAAQADDTWTGASTASNKWSFSANWSSGVPTNPAGTLTFPDLGSCGGAACYTSNNDLSNLSVTGVVFSNSSGTYQLIGNGLTVGTGGIVDTSGGGAADTINAPLVLSAPQKWVVGSLPSSYDILGVHGGVTGTDALTLSLPQGDLFIDSDMEVGPVTSNGGGIHIGGPPGSNAPGSVNWSDRQPVTINGGPLIANPDAKTGPLNVSNAALLLGTNLQLNGATTLQVNGPAQLGSSTTTSTFINGNGPVPGTDFSQLSATGNITLGGRLILGQGTLGSSTGGPCIALSAGDVATLVATAGRLSGMFTNARQGAILTLASSCQHTPPQVQIHYTRDSVTATVVTGRLVGPTGRLTVLGRTIPVVERCQSGALCRGRFSFTLAVRGHKGPATLLCASAGFRVRARHAATIGAKLSPGCLRRLRAQRRRTLAVTYTSQSETGQAGERRRITLVLR